jgi:hypothetical protein
MNEYFSQDSVTSVVKKMPEVSGLDTKKMLTDLLNEIE